MNAGATEPESYEDYLSIDYGWRSWLFTTDHKRIGLLYLVSITLFFFLGLILVILLVFVFLNECCFMFCSVW
jgi:cytochrome c oxidase subunit 1